MKSKELIRRLQEEDPSGETEVCVNNVDIEDIFMSQAYYDGRLQILERDADGYVIGGKYTSKGMKIVMCPTSITDLLWHQPEAKIDYSELGGSRPDYEASDNKTREASRNVTLRVEMEAFQRWVKKKADAIRDNEGKDVKWISDSFFTKNLHVDDPLKELPKQKRTLNGQEYEVWPSVNERRESGWDDKIEVYWRGGWGIRMKDGSATEGE